MEESKILETNKICAIPIELEEKFLNNNNEGNKENKSILEELNDIINNINKDFDFQSFEKEKMHTIEKVIKFI